MSKDNVKRVRGKAKSPFHPRAFLSKINGGGRTISEYKTLGVIYRQGDQPTPFSTSSPEKPR